MYVYDLDVFVTVQILEDTPAVLPLGKLCEDHGFSFSKWQIFQYNTEDYVPTVVHRLVLPVRLQVHLQHRYRKTQQKTAPSSPATIDVEVHAVEYGETKCTFSNNQRMISRTSIQYGEHVPKSARMVGGFHGKIEKMKEC